MPIDVNSAARTKEMILSAIKIKGPSLPINIARDVKTSTLFASAFLSELYNEIKLKMSNLKVGSTSLYYLPGQEEQLENFIQFLNHKEQEAFHLIKQHGILDETLLQPAIRVAIKEIKDFAYPYQENLKTFWRYSFLKNNAQVPQKSPANIPLIPNIAASIQQAVHSQLNQQELEAKPLEQISSSEPKLILEEKKELKRKTPKPKIKTDFSFSLSPIIEKKKEETQFGKKVREYCKNKDIHILEIIEENKKDFSGLLELETSLGKNKYYCIAKDKKKLNEQDIQLALQKAQEKRMPVLLLLTAPLDKKGLSFIDPWQNLIKVDKLK